jgi:hypothetical protein
VLQKPDAVLTKALETVCTQALSIGTAQQFSPFRFLHPAKMPPGLFAP